MKVLHTIAGKHCPHTGWTSAPSGESGRKSYMPSLTIHNFVFTYRLFGPFISFPVFLYRKNFISCWVFGPFSSSLSLQSLHVSHHQDHHTHVYKFWCEGILSCYTKNIYWTPCRLPYTVSGTRYLLGEGQPSFFHFFILILVDVHSSHAFSSISWPSLWTFLCPGFYPHWIFLHDLEFRT